MLVLAIALAAMPSHGAKKPIEPRTWIVDMSHGHVAYLRLADEADNPTRPAELRIAYKDALAADGGDVMVFQLNFTCSGPPAEFTGEIAFHKGELWKRDPGALIRELTPDQFDALRGRVTLDKARVCACVTAAVRDKNVSYVKVPRLTQVYFALLGQGVQYQVALAFANSPDSDDLEPGGWKAFNISSNDWKTVKAILEWRKLPVTVPQAAP